MAGLFVVGGIAASVVNSQTLTVRNDDSKCLCEDVTRSRGEQCASEKSTLDLTMGLAVSSFVIAGAVAITSAVLIALKPRDAEPTQLSCGGGPGEFGIACVGSF